MCSLCHLAYVKLDLHVQSSSILVCFWDVLTAGSLFLSVNDYYRKNFHAARTQAS